MSRVQKHIGKQIRKAREVKGWSARELGRRFKVSIASISRWENGIQQISHEDLQRLARLLDKPVQYFLPKMFISPDNLSPEVAQLVHEINEIDDEGIKTQLVSRLEDITQMTLASMRAGEHRRSRE